MEELEQLGERDGLDLTGIDLTDLDRFVGGFPHATFARLRREAFVDRFDGLIPDGPVEWARTNKHTGVRHPPVTLVARDRHP